MIKLRNAYYCNLKLFLIFLVILGHFLEPQIGKSPALYRLYRTIYLFHMPLFAFVSGLFLKDPAGCLRQLKRLLPRYLIFQAAAVLLKQTAWHTPWWVLWYLLSTCFWLGASALLLKWKGGKWLILLLALALGCLSGNANRIGRAFSLSRTIVFFPWFWLGVSLTPRIPWHRLRLPGLLALIGVIVSRPVMPAAVLYQAGPCDPLLRLRCYALAAALGLFILSWCPARRFPWTRAGADTMPAYLLHGPAVALLRPVPHPVLATVLFLYIIHKATQWHSIYGITGKEECSWPDLKTYTKPRASRSTGSSWP